MGRHARRSLTYGQRALAGAIAVLALAPAGAAAATITVNSTADTAANDGACTLREAITAANDNAVSGVAANECAAGQADPTADTIEFDITGAGPHVISPGSPYSEIEEVVTIDGGTDNTPGPGADEIRLDGAGAGPAFGFDVRADGVTIDSMTITRFSNAIQLFEVDGATVTASNLGTDSTGTAGIGNVGRGILGQDIADAEIRGNLISSNGSWGVQITGPSSTGNVVAANRVGTNPAGTAALANGLAGIEITGGGDSNTIGGAALSDANLISGNTQTGIRIAAGTTADRSVGNEIRRNRIGTTLNGESDLGNAFHGIDLSGGVDDTVIRSNLISGNDMMGIELIHSGSQPVGADGPTGNEIAANKIGTDKDGTTAIGNVQQGVGVLGASDHPSIDNVIGGTSGLTPSGACTGDCNIVSASTGANQSGISITNGAEGTHVLGNHIGTDLAGTADLGHPADGVSVSTSTGTVVGSPAAPNLISGNGRAGVQVAGTAQDGTIQANLIGTQADGSTPLPNDDFGIEVQAGTGMLIGGIGAGEGNVIANSTDGVRVSGGDEIAILGNAIRDTASGLGINLFGTGGIEPNDPDDTDAGPNGLQNYPELSSAVNLGTSTLVSGTLNSAPDASYRLEFFSNAAPNPSGHGDGETFLGAFDVTTDGDGDASFADEVAGAAPIGDAVSATATELGPLGEQLRTSEFAANVTALACDVTGTTGDDTLTGTGGGDDVICGLEGDDTITPDGGDDIVVGGEGADEIDLSAAGSAVDLDLAVGAGTVGADALTVLQIEDATGSDFDDTIGGDDGANKLTGGDGKDTLKGEDGDDTLKGKDSKDTLKSGDGKDKIRAGDGNDDLQGGGGNKDDLDGDEGEDGLDGGGGDNDDCDGGPDKDTHEGGCEKKTSL